MTTSHTTHNIKNNSNIVDALNHICYGKLPNILQSLESYRQVILTIHPIVNFYDDCKATLSLVNSLTTYPMNNEEISFVESPIK